MAAEIVNLNRARKAKKKTQKSAQKAVNRTKFGRNRATRNRDQEDRVRQDNELDGKRLSDDAKGDDN